MKFNNNVFGNVGRLVEAFLRVSSILRICEGEKFSGKKCICYTFFLLLLFSVGFFFPKLRSRRGQARLSIAISRDRFHFSSSLRY